MKVANFGKCRTAVFLASALAILATVSVCVGGGYGADLAWMNVTTVGGGVPAPTGDTYSDLTLFWRCNSLTLGAGDTYQTDTSVDVAESSAACNTDAVKIGTNGFDMPGESDKGSLGNSNDYVTSSEEGRFGAWVRITTWAQYFCILYITDASSDNQLTLAFSGTDELQVAWVGGANDPQAATTTDANLGTGTWYFIEVAWKRSTNLLKIYVNNTEKASFSGTLNAWTATPNEVAFGDIFGVGGDVHMDNIMLSTSSTRSLYAIRDEATTPKP